MNIHEKVDQQYKVVEFYNKKVTITNDLELKIENQVRVFSERFLNTEFTHDDYIQIAKELNEFTNELYVVEKEKLTIRNIVSSFSLEE